MKVYVVMATIYGSTALRGVYRKEADAKARCEEVKGFSFFLEDQGDEVWIQEEEVE